MKRLFLLIACCSFAVFSFAVKKSVTFNVMISDGSGEKAVRKLMKEQNGVYKTKADCKTGSVEIEYDDEKTNVAELTTAFKKGGFYASPVGENCANKPGGCLNNAPTTTNIMR